MDRRGFLGMMIGGIATAAAVRTFPFRVFSFPKEIKVVNAANTGLFFETWDDWNQQAIYKNGLGNLAHQPSLNAFPNSFRRFYPDESLGQLPLGSAPPKWICTKIEGI